MSAVEEYRKERLRRGPDVDGLTADAAVAELERDKAQADTIIATLRDMEIDATERAERAEAELASARP